MRVKMRMLKGQNVVETLSTDFGNMKNISLQPCTHEPDTK